MILGHKRNPYESICNVSYLSIKSKEIQLAFFSSFCYNKYIRKEVQMLKAIFFDLDGTLLPMDEEKFTKLYFQLISEAVKDKGYEPQKLIDTIWQGTKCMYKNNSGQTNEEVFWNYFGKIYGEEHVQDKKYFDAFYVNQFKQVKKACGENPYAKEIVQYAKEKVGMVMLTTNPIFPKNGIKTRLEFLNLVEEDFDYITTYENSFHCKPNPEYFKDLLHTFSLQSDEVILFGNNDMEDYFCAKQAGIDCYLVGENLILHKDENMNAPKIKMNEIKDIIEKEYNRRKNENISIATPRT